MDRSATVALQHLRAALAFWQYSEDSVKLIFADHFGDPRIGLITRVLKAVPALPRQGIYDLFSRNIKKAEVDHIVEVLCSTGIAELKTIKKTEVLVKKK